MTYLLYTSARDKAALEKRMAAEWDAMMRTRGQKYHWRDREAVLGALEKVLSIMGEPEGGRTVAARLEGDLDGKWLDGSVVCLRGVHCRIDVSYAK